MSDSNKNTNISSSPWYGWQNLPDIVISDIMMMLGLDWLEDLHKCRQVCQSWNVMISQMIKYKKGNIRTKAETLATKPREEWVWSHSPPLPKIVTAASLAHHGIPCPVWGMCLKNVDLASVPSEHLASLISCMTGFLFINNMSNFDLINILDSVKCEWLFINSQTLSSEETQALVRAMESGVEEVWLGEEGEVSLDIRALTQYSGQGKCGWLRCYGDTTDRYMEAVRSWAQRNNWQVIDYEDFFDIAK